MLLDTVNVKTAYLQIIIHVVASLFSFLMHALKDTANKTCRLESKQLFALPGPCECYFMNASCIPLRLPDVVLTEGAETISGGQGGSGAEKG